MVIIECVMGYVSAWHMGANYICVRIALLELYIN